MSFEDLTVDITSAQPLIFMLALRNIGEVTRTQPSGLATISKSSQAKEVATLTVARRIERILKAKKNPKLAIHYLQQ